jgi:hypothetical protein
VTGTFTCDVSSYQPPVDDSYPWPWLIFRACDGTYRDSNFAANLAWAKKAAAAGKLAGYTVYAVYEPGVDTLGTVKAMVGTPDDHITVMIDVESWGGKIQGNRSADVTALWLALGTWLGDQRRVIVYGNQNDLASLYTTRPPGVRLVVASYGSIKPNVPGQIGWQYSDGQTLYPLPAGWPRSSPPFGACDHNHFDLDPADLAATLGVGADMPLDPNDPVVVSIYTRIHDAAQGTTNNVNTHVGGLTNQLVALAAQVTALQSTVAKLTAGSGGVAPTSFVGTVKLDAAP